MITDVELNDLVHQSKVLASLSRQRRELSPAIRAAAVKATGALIALRDLDAIGKLNEAQVELLAGELREANNAMLANTKTGESLC